ncbi:hypothetical protein [Pedobacter sp.]|uniref:hypothetical protein n=1 Tax=Pedobacter sp. TaxID=1411316 RepID=UPI003C43EA1C
MKKEVQEYITELLLIFKERIPMSPARANLTLSDNGDLRLSVIIDNMWYDWTFDEDFEKSPVDLAEYIISEYKVAGILS